MTKRLKKIRDDKEVEKLIEGDLSDLIDSDNFQPVSFEYAPKDKSISLRISGALLDAVKKASKKRGIGYQRYIREVLERSLSKDN